MKCGGALSKKKNMIRSPVQTVLVANSSITTCGGSAAPGFCADERRRHSVVASRPGNHHIQADVTRSKSMPRWTVWFSDIRPEEERSKDREHIS